MKDAFPGHFANDPDDLQRLWEGSLIAVDANVLLSLYRYSEGTRNEFLEVFEKLKDRLWVPHQVVKEYLRNRLKVISDQAKTYDAAIKELGELRGKFEDPKQHPFVSADALADCARSFGLIIDELKQNKERHDNKINDDDIKQVVSRIFDGRVGPSYTSEQLEEFIVKGADRYANKVPPGFKDADKAGGSSLEERLAPYGDYIGWLQLLDKSKLDGRDIIYVTGDNKEDWWLKQSGRTVGPLPDLIDEFMSFTSQRFYMYLPDRFLRRAGEFLQQAVSEKAMNEVRDVRLEELNEKMHMPQGQAKPKWWVDPDYPIDLAVSEEQKSIWLNQFIRGEVSKRPRVNVYKLHHRAGILNAEISRISAELDRRLIEGASDEFGDYSDAQLEQLMVSIKSDLSDVLMKIEHFDLANLIKGKG